MAVNSNALVPTESAWVDRLFTQAAFSPEYQDLKFTLHRKLLDRINLEMLSSVAVDRVRSEVRSAVARLVDEEAVSQISRRGQGDQANQARDHEREQHFNQGQSARHATRWHEAVVHPSSL